MANYMAAWRAFRRLSDEPAVTAGHVLRQPAWPATEGLTILDIGCGDGRMVEAFLLAGHRRIAKVTLLDPDAVMLREAASEIRRLGLNLTVEPQIGLADLQGLEQAANADVALAIHVVYLLPFTRFQHLIQGWPSKVPLYVVLDSPDSVFTKLWRKTAPEFAMRASRVHEFLSHEANGSLRIRKTSFATRVANPLDLGEDVRSLVLSLVCYADYEGLPSDTRDHVQATVRDHLDGDCLGCSCTCYEVVRS